MKLILSFLVFSLLTLIIPTSAFATEAAFSCVPATGTYKVGDTITVDYNLNTRSFTTNGAAVVATFDPSVLSPIGTTSTPITSSTSWGQPTTNSIDTSVGKITLDYGNAQPAFTGSASIGQAKFQAKAAGQAQFNYVFFQQYDDTTPGVAKVWGRKTEGAALSNILTDVTNCIYVIEGVTPTPTAGPTSTPGPTAIASPRPTITQLPRAGNTEVTLSLLGLSGLLLAIGVLLPKFAYNKD